MLLQSVEATGLHHSKCTGREISRLCFPRHVLYVLPVQNRDISPFPVCPRASRRQEGYAPRSACNGVPLDDAPLWRRFASLSCMAVSRQRRAPPIMPCGRRCGLEQRTALGTTMNGRAQLGILLPSPRACGTRHVEAVTAHTWDQFVDVTVMV
jgi:hypothetical protein